MLIGATSQPGSVRGLCVVKDMVWYMGAVTNILNGVCVYIYIYIYIYIHIRGN